MPLHHKQTIHSAAPIRLTNGSTMTPSHKGILPNLPDISDEHKTCQICPNNNSPALLFLGQLYDDNCIVVCNTKKYIIYKDKPILWAKRCPTSGMHITNLNNPLLTQTEINSAPTQTKMNLVNVNLKQFTSIERLKFLDGALGFPPISTL